MSNLPVNHNMHNEGYIHVPGGTETNLKYDFIERTKDIVNSIDFEKKLAANGLTTDDLFAYIAAYNEVDSLEKLTAYELSHVNGFLNESSKSSTVFKLFCEQIHCYKETGWAKSIHKIGI